MARGPLSEETKRKRALALAAQFLNKEIDEIELPKESTEDKIREAQSVINYFEVRGTGFKKRICRTCGKMFAYAYHIDAIKYCSIECISIALEKIGFKWDPTKPVEQRWGHFVPAIVPPSALEVLEDLVSALEDQPSDTTS